MNLKTIASFLLSRRVGILAAAGVLVAGTGLTVASGVWAQTPPPATPSPATTPGPGPKAHQPFFSHDQLEAKLAQRLGIDAQKLREAMIASEKDLVQEAVQAGRLTQAQADEINRRIDASGGHPFFGMHGGKQGGMHGDKRGHFGPQGQRGPGMGRRGPQLSQEMTLQAAATFLGVSLDDLRAALRQGKSLAQVAADHGKTRQDLKTALTQNVTSRTDQAVKDGRITQQQADQLRQTFASRVDKLLDQSFPARPAPRATATPTA